MASPPEEFPFYEAVQQVIGDTHQFQNQYPQGTNQPNSISLSVPNPNVLPKGPVAERGVAYALYVKGLARNEFKARRRQELLDSGNQGRIQRHRRNDTSLNAQEKYLRRLRKNQDSAAAARYAHEAYVGCLEDQAEAYDAEVAHAQQELAIAEMQRDNEAELLRQNQTYNTLVMQQLLEVKQDVEAMELYQHRPPPAM